MKNKIITGTLILVLGATLNAQEQIELPDLTTVITAESVVAQKDALPDFKDVIVVLNGTSDLVPELPDVEVEDSQKNLSLDNPKEQKSIYAEGQFGGGYPTMFLGDFSLYRLNGVNPFKVEFNHNAASGYAHHSLNDGYNHSNTQIYVEQSFDLNNILVNYGANYKSLSNGLQNKVTDISDIKQYYICGFANADFKLPKHFTIGTNLNADFYTRYLDITTTSTAISVEDKIKSAKFYNVSPGFYGSWENNGFKTSLSGKYLFDGSSRAQFDYYFGWGTEFFNAFGQVGVIAGQNLNDNKVLVPFTIGVDANFPVYFSNRNVGLNIQGGLESYKQSVADFEQQYKFTNFLQKNSEISSWYVKADFSVPIFQLFTGKASVNFKKTAFDNGVWTPYESAANYGLYDYTKKNLTALTTDLSLIYRYKLFNFELGWKSNWLDIPVFESEQLLTFNCGFQNESGFVGANFISGFYFGDGVDYPLLSANFFVKVSSAARIVIACDDILKLVTNKERVYAGQYISTGGSVSGYVKFFF